MSKVMQITGRLPANAKLVISVESVQAALAINVQGYEVETV